jgi:RNA polymerase sporulation-specific sigma factor
MFSVSLLLLLQAAFWSLRLGINGGSFPRILTQDEERDLLAKYALGDQTARGKLIEHNLRLVAHVCKKYYSKAEHDDLISIGTIGLIKAIDTFKSDKNARLATYAARCIENEILMQFRKERKMQGDVSLNGILETDSEDGGLSLLDALCSTEENLLEQLDRRENCKKLKAFILEALDEREQSVIIHRFGLNGLPPKTQTEVGDLLNISRSYISRIEKRAISKLRAKFV